MSIEYYLNIKMKICIGNEIYLKIVNKKLFIFIISYIIKNGIVIV
jgi:hypothetical protein